MLCCFGFRARLAVSCQPMLFTQAAFEAGFMAIFVRTCLIARLGHLTPLPQAIMLAAIMLSDSLARATFGSARTFSSHYRSPRSRNLTVMRPESWPGFFSNAVNCFPNNSTK